jgi:signal transduction histidine kinase
MSDEGNVHLRVLAEVSHEFSAVVIDYRLLIDTIARTTADLVGDGCMVTLIGEDGETLFNAASAHRDPALEADYRAWLAGMGVSKTASASVSAAVIRTGQPQMADVEPTTLVAQTDETLKPLVARLNVHSFAVVPIRARQRIIGSLSMLRSGPGCSYTAEDVTLLCDLADRAGLAIENARLYAKLADAVEARDQFLSLAAHELKTPLTALQLMVQNVRRRQLRNEVEISAIARQVTKLGTLIDRLLDVACITSGSLHLSRSRVDLGEIVSAVLDGSQELIQQAGSEIRVGGDPLVGFWDSLRLEAVVSNLLGNALKYGLGRPIDIAISRHGGRARLSVADRGIGISAGDQARIFKRFERAVSERHYGGLGIGLWVVAQIVEAHGGKVHLISQPGAGSTFVVELPVEQGGVAANDADARQP